MAHFPIANSILSASHLGQFVKEKYNLNGNVICSLIRAGINHSYLIQNSSEKFVFRVYSLNWRTKTEILEEIRLIDLLKSKQISVSTAIEDNQNEYIQSLNAPEGNRFGVLFTFAEGGKLHSFSEETHYHIGQLMANLHIVTKDQKINRVTYTLENLVKDSLVKISEFLSEQTEEMAFLKSTEKLLIVELQKINNQDVRNGIVHLDIWFDNLNIDNNTATIFDFDFCGNGWLSLDLAYYMMQVYNIERDEAECKMKLESFFNGYESIVKIPLSEKRILPVLGVSLYFFYLGIQCERFENWSNSFLNETYLKRYINQIVKRYFLIHKLEK